MLDDCDRSSPIRIKFRDTFECCIGIVDIVEGKLFSLHLARRCDTGPLLRGPLEPRSLMGIFAISHGFGQLPAERTIGWALLADFS